MSQRSLRQPGGGDSPGRKTRLNCSSSGWSGYVRASSRPAS